MPLLPFMILSGKALVEQHYPLEQSTQQEVETLLINAIDDFIKQKSTSY